MNTLKTQFPNKRSASPIISLSLLAVITTGLFTLLGCGGPKAESKRDEFFTSGSREADQRATQRMAKDEQLAGSGEGAGEKGRKKSTGAATNSAATNKVEGKVALFERLGGEPGISNIVADFLPRALQDPRVNWPRKGEKSGSIFRSDAKEWSPTPESLAVLEKHLVQFISLATGGPSQYEGKAMKATHEGMRITNPEFDAVIGDFKSTLDKLQIPNREQKELIAVVESTRPQIVTVR